eukprot:CAMPEP_0113626094 /NCGR_PEP_ID=MMETSP0017_2-20120614/13488_1 /TAXON_ID=2856 /ORGANISM="Cylindrotheca closterium" /LENGTH=295 /DNA_ID=CAMNT_0000536249 /DNA_START=157 /DNA_END=1044 /DNA_ORIENTATION=+ /assembly_acc=CAM_ASM_000147
MGEAKDSPQKRKQFAVTCTIMGGVIVYMLMTSGAFQAVAPIQGKFPGGNYIYKYTARDYAASGGLGRAIMEDLINTQVAKKMDIIPQYKLEEQVHHLYLDNPSGKGGSRQRFMSGLLIPKSKKTDDKSIDLLMGLNDETKRTEFTKDELHALSAIEVFQLLPYETNELPAVDALVLQFPWTGGISSMLVQSMKIIPRMHKIAAETLNNNGQTIVLSACSKEEQMCTHYAPLVNVEDFLLGRPTTKDFNDDLGREDVVDWEGLTITLDYAKTRMMEWTGLKKKEKEPSAEEAKAEL